MQKRIRQPRASTGEREECEYIWEKGGVRVCHQELVDSKSRVLRQREN